MSDIRSDWTTLKALVDQGQVTLSYVNSMGNYYIYSSPLPSTFILICILEEATEDAIDFETNYKDNSTAIV